MNENKMMSYEMYEELKSSILKTIKTEIANVKPVTIPPNNLPQQIEQAVTNGLAKYGTTLGEISESFTTKQTEVLNEVKNLHNAVSAIEIPKELPPRLHNHRHIIGSESKSIIIFFVTSIVMMIFMAIAIWNAYQPNIQRDDNDLKYRYMKMEGDASPAMIAELEDLFTLNRDVSRIEAMRANVVEYEETILRQAALAEQARLKAQEAQLLDNKAKSIKSK